MAASTTWTQPTLCSTWVTGVRCTGFAKVSGKNDYAFIIETEWSDGRQFFVKRTFGDFQVFQGCLLKSFPALTKADRDKLGLRSGIKDLFVKDKKQLAESREQLVDAYLKNVIRLPEKVAQSALVLSFFESRSSDPKPCKPGSPKNPELHPDCVPAPCDDYLEHGIDRGVDGIDRGERDPRLHAQCQHEGTDIELAWNEDDDYFLDVGLHELMLTDTSQPADPSTTMCPESMWCSNIDKFSTLLRTSITSMPPPQRNIKQASQAETTSIGEKCGSTSFSHSDEECNGEAAENSDTESQLTEPITDYPDEKIESGDELYSRAVAAAMGQESTRLYYLCTGETA